MLIINDIHTYITSPIANNTSYEEIEYMVIFKASSCSVLN
jgi:hypothetical protein